MLHCGCWHDEGRVLGKWRALRPHERSQKLAGFTGAWPWREMEWKMVSRLTQWVGACQFFFFFQSLWKIIQRAMIGQPPKTWLEFFLKCENDIRIMVLKSLHVYSQNPQKSKCPPSQESLKGPSFKAQTNKKVHICRLPLSRHTVTKGLIGRSALPRLAVMFQDISWLILDRCLEHKCHADLRTMWRDLSTVLCNISVSVLKLEGSFTFLRTFPLSSWQLMDWLSDQTVSQQSKIPTTPRVWLLLLLSCLCRWGVRSVFRRLPRSDHHQATYSKPQQGNKSLTCQMPSIVTFFTSCYDRHPEHTPMQRPLRRRCPQPLWEQGWGSASLLQTQWSVSAFSHSDLICLNRHQDWYF